MVNLSDIAASTLIDFFQNPNYMRPIPNTKAKPVVEKRGNQWFCFDKERTFEAAHSTAKGAYERWCKVNDGRLRMYREQNAIHRRFF